MTAVSRHSSATGTSVADGIYIMLAPLSPGAHTIRFRVDFPASGFSIDTTYNLTIS